MKTKVKNKLLELGNYAISSGELIEDALLEIEEILEDNPEGVSIFVDMFNDARNINSKDIIALIIIPHLANTDVIAYLQENEGWTKQDFEGTPAESYFTEKP